MRNLRERVEVSRKENLFLPCLMLQNQQLELSKCCNFSEYLEYVIRCRQNLFSHPEIIFSINFWNVDLFKITTWEKIHSCFVKNPFHFFPSYPHAAPYFNIYYFFPSEEGVKRSPKRGETFTFDVQKICCPQPYRKRSERKQRLPDTLSRPELDPRPSFRPKPGKNRTSGWSTK